MGCFPAEQQIVHQQVNSVAWDIVAMHHKGYMTPTEKARPRLTHLWHYLEIKRIHAITSKGAK
jgi:hypothetical protein